MLVHILRVYLVRDRMIVTIIRKYHTVKFVVDYPLRPDPVWNVTPDDVV